MIAGKDANDWDKREAPSLAALETLADAAYRRLPDAFRRLIGDVIVRVEDFVKGRATRLLDEPRAEVLLQ